jgi:DNA anti-recombination protein RmuC
MTKVKISISVDEEHLSEFSKVMKKVEKAGMQIDQELEDIGVATGSIDEEKVGKLRDVEGVNHVEEERQIQIPPPESDVQ